MLCFSIASLSNQITLGGSYMSGTETFAGNFKLLAPIG